jgi:hypothetical protein
MGPVTDPARVNPHIAAFLAAHGAGAPGAASANASGWRQVA